MAYTLSTDTEKRKLAAEVPDLYRPLLASPAFVIGQLGQSLDGRIATPSGDSKYISGDTALCHLHQLRALVDAVVVGVQTVIADDPQLTVRHVEGRSPARVVIDPNGRMPNNARLFSDGGPPVLVVQTTDLARPPGVVGIKIPKRGGEIPPGDIVSALADLGYQRLLIEGGACTLSKFLAAGMLARLHITVAPFIIGSGLAGISLPAIRLLNEASRPQAKIYQLGADVLFDLAFT
jgi:diaminohydroxyphosphoribosylaminopyrimidine deaminase/5-amino-6-(5-phosphoribosylamino)uracil reductase